MRTDRDKLILDNINLIYYVLKQYGLYKNKDEYYDICMIGLCKAANFFDESKGYTFCTYGVSCIRTELLGHLRKEKNNKRIANYKTISLDTTVCENEGKEITLLDTLSSDINIEEEIINKEQQELFIEALKVLDDVELKVLSYMYGINGCEELTQFEISKIVGFSQANVSRVGKRAINKMKYYLKVNRGIDNGR